MNNNINICIYMQIILRTTNMSTIQIQSKILKIVKNTMKRYRLLYKDKHFSSLLVS